MNEIQDNARCIVTFSIKPDEYKALEKVVQEREGQQRTTKVEVFRKGLDYFKELYGIN